MRSGSAVRLGLLVRERREAKGYRREDLLSVLAFQGGDVEVSYDFLVELELRRRHLALEDPRFWMIAKLLNINTDDIVGCVIGAIEDRLSAAP